MEEALLWIETKIKGILQYFKIFVFVSYTFGASIYGLIFNPGSL